MWIGAWLYVLEGHMGGLQPVLLLDTDLEENRREDREITHYLYGGDETYRLKQEIVLGIGGVRLLQALGFKIRQYHMNEGHSALLGLDCWRLYPPGTCAPRLPYDVPRVRELRHHSHAGRGGHDRLPTSWCNVFWMSSSNRGADNGRRRAPA